MKDWEITSFDDIERGNIVEFVQRDSAGRHQVRKTGTVLTVQTVRTIGPTLGHIELYLDGVGPITASASTEIEVYR